MNRRLLAVAVALVAVLFAVRGAISDWRLALSYDIAWDLDIYIQAIERMDAGVSIYDWVNEFGMGFTYPPIAALLMSPLTWASQAVVTKIWLVLSISVAVLLVVVMRRLSGRLDWSTWGVAVVAASIGAFLGTSTVQDNLISGQVNLFLALLLLLDVGQVIPPRYRGLLVGLAAAVKLTPLIVLAWYVMTRQWKAAVRAFSCFVICAIVGFAFLPNDARDFWTEAVFDARRVGPLDLPGNASLTGTLAKAGVEPPILTVVWLSVGTLLVLAAFAQAERSRRRGDHAGATVILGAAAIVASPISWPAHQIWLPLAGLLLAWRGGTGLRLLGLGLVAFSYLHIPLSQLWDGRGTLELVLDDLDFAIFALICLFGLGSNVDRDRSTPIQPISQYERV